MLRYLALHESAVSRFGPNQLRAVNEYHKQKFAMQAKSGWWIGYNDFIDTDASITHIRDFGEETAAVLGHNTDTISVCVAFNGDKELPSDAQLKTLRNYISKIKGTYPDIEIVFHRDLQPNRTCPGALITQNYLKTVILNQWSPEWKDGDDLEKQRKIKELISQISLLQILVGKLQTLIRK